MKLHEIINRLDMSDENEDQGIYWDMSSMVSDLSLSCYGVTQDDKNPLLKCYWVANHVCTDTWVGIRAYFLNSELVALSTQSCRKGDESFEWVSIDAQRNVRNYILSLDEKESFEPDKNLLDMEEEFGEGYPIQYTGQMLKQNVIYKDSIVKVIKDTSEGYSNFHTITVELDNGDKKDIDVREILVPWYIK